MLPRPAKIPSAKEKANLKRGGSPGRPKKSRTLSEGEKFARKIIDDPLYRRNLYNRARKGTLQPGVEALLIQLAKGKPKDTLEIQQGPANVKITHKYSNDDPSKKTKGGKANAK